jgi:methylated-DNA-protein-cysteine methyltransferase-like protein
MHKKALLFKKILAIVAKIPTGKVTTYGEIARSIGLKDARVVGWALHQNEDPIKYPCHRVVNKLGGLSKGYVFGGKGKQAELLSSEGVILKKDGSIELNQCLWIPNAGDD